MATRRLHAAGPITVGDLLGGGIRPAAVLGTFPTAIYLRLAGGEVIAVLTREAIQLPLGLTLTADSSELPLDRWTGPVRVGAGQVQVGDRSIRISRVVSVTAPTQLKPNGAAVAYVWRRLSVFGEAEPRPGLVDVLMSHQGETAPDTVVHRLLGVGPGLTPSGDDILAGYLVGAWSFGLDAGRLRTAALEAAPTATSELSAALLRCAARGESIPQVSGLLSVISEANASAPRLNDALDALGRVGHTSGVSLAAGAVAAAQVAGLLPPTLAPTIAVGSG